MIDTKDSSAGDEISTAQIKSHKIKKVLGNIHSYGIFRNKVRVEYEDGSQTTIYDKGNTDTGEQVCEIPDGWYIVGFYGRCNPNEYIR